MSGALLLKYSVKHYANGFKFSEGSLFFVCSD